MIANEFTEATGDVYLSSLVELGLVLFAPHHGSQCSRTVADHRHHAERIETDLMDQLKRRNFLNNLMLTLTGVCTVITSSILFLILGFLVYNGWRSLNWDFFTKLPLSAGEMGGGLGTPSWAAPY